MLGDRVDHNVILDQEADPKGGSERLRSKRTSRLLASGIKQEGPLVRSEALKQGAQAQGEASCCDRQVLHTTSV